MKRYLFLSVTLILFLSFAVNTFAVTYYVKNGGSDGNTGLSDAQAWETVSKVNSSVSGTGDDVYFKCDDTWTGTQLKVDWSGNATNRAVVGAYYMDGGETIGVSGNKPIIDGNDSVPGDYVGLVHVTGNYADIENLRIINSEGSGIRFYQTNNNNASDIETDNTYRAGIQYYQCTTGIADGCDIREAARKNPESGGDWPANFSVITSSYITIKKNIIHESYGEGIGLFRGSNDNTVEDNICYANKHLGIYIDRGRRNIVKRNLIYGTTNTAYHRYTGFCGAGLGVNDESGQSGNLSEDNEFYYNLVAFCSTGIWLATQDASAVLKNTVIYGNTFVDCGKSVSAVGGPWQNSFIKNNIFWCISGDCIQADVSSSHPGLTLDYNLWSSTPDSDAQGANDPAYAAPLLTKTSGWRLMTGGDLTGNDFTLQDSSPAINVGTDLGASYDDGLNPTSVWPDSVSTLDQDSYGLWEIGGFVYTGTILPVVTTQAVTDITTTTAIGHGTIADVGGESNCTKRGICWNTTGSPTIADDNVTEIGSFPAGAFSGNMTGLTLDQAYFARAYAYNTDGYGYGSTEGFNTDADASGTYIIDDGDAETSSTGSWPISGGANPYGSDSLYCNEVNSTYTYEKSLDGNYTVSMWWTWWSSRSTAVTVKIYDSGDNLLDTKSVNQQNNASQWNELDTYDFNATAKMVILSTGGGPSTCADAVKFDYVEGSGGEDVNNPSCLHGIHLHGCVLN